MHQFVPVAADAKDYTEQGFTVVQSARQDGIFQGQAFVASLGKGLPGELVLKAAAKQVALEQLSLAELQAELDRGLVAIIADTSGFHGLITRVDLLNHLRKALP